MSEVLQLGATFVGAQPTSTGYSTSVNFSPRPPLKPNEQFISGGFIQKLIANGVNVFTAANVLDVEGAMNASLIGLNGLDSEQLKAQLTMQAAIQKNLLKDRASRGAQESVVITAQERTEIAYASATWAHNTATVDHSAHPDFFGTPLMFMAGLYYWLYGKGETRYVNIGSLNLQMVTRDIPPVRDAVAANGPGIYPINSPFTYNTFGPGYLTSFAGLLLGRVSGNVSGVLTIAANGTYVFTGTYTLNPDVFDADPSHRPPVQEALTTILRAIGDQFGHVDFTTVVLGSQPLILKGSK